MQKERKLVFWLVFWIVLVLVALLITGYYIYFFSNECGDKACFEKSLAKCQKTFYTNSNDEMALDYTILEKVGDKCNVNVKLLQVKSGAAELENLQNLEMICALDFGVVSEPEKNLGSCHGVLKEGIQEIIIKRMHSQIVENIGKISESVTKVL